MHQEAEKLIGKQAQEVGEVRKLADELIKQNLSSKQQPIEQEPEVDFFENPQKAVQRTIDSHPDVVAARQAGIEFKKAQIQQRLAQAHSDYVQVAQDQDFVNWVKSSPVRLGLYAKADGEFDFDSANELISTYKELRGVKTKQAEQAGQTARANSMKAAAVDCKLNEADNESTIGCFLETKGSIDDFLYDPRLNEDVIMTDSTYTLSDFSFCRGSEPQQQPQQQTSQQTQQPTQQQTQQPKQQLREVKVQKNPKTGETFHVTKDPKTGRTFWYKQTDILYATPIYEQVINPATGKPSIKPYTKE
jgi:hypothetical protein